MRMRIALLSICVIAGICLPLGSALLASEGNLPPNERPLEILPADHWANEELRKLWVAGILDSFFLCTRPVSRYDVAAALLALEQGGRTVYGMPAAERLLREFSRELRYLQHTDAARESAGKNETPFIFETRGRELDFRVSLYTDFAIHKECEGKAIVQEGSRAGVRIQAFLRPGITLFEDVYVGKHSEAWRYSEELFDLDDVVVFTDRFYVALRTSLFDATVGRDRIRWGPGRTGTLLLSDSAPTYTLFTLSRALGKRLKVSTLSAILDSQDGKYLAAHRLDVVPWDFLQVGVSETAVYHSRYIEPLYAISIVPFTFVERLLHRDSRDTRPDDPLRNNIALGADFVLRPVREASLYGELMLDDVAEETGKRPTRLAYQLGTAVSKQMGKRGVNFVGELSRVWNYTYSVCYSMFYDRDHSHQGSPLGYDLGPDSRRILALASVDLSRDLEAGLSWTEVLAGEGTLEEPWCEDEGEVNAAEFSGTLETTRTATAFVNWMPRDNVRLETSVGLAGTENESHIRGENRMRVLLSARLAARW